MLNEIFEVVDDPTIQEVFAPGQDEPVSVLQYLDTNRRGFAELRLEHETAYLSEAPILRCAACHQVVVPRRHYDSFRRYFKHREGDGNCPYATKGKASQRQIDAMRYNGQKEGQDHLELKNFVEHSLRQDSAFSNVLVERRWWGVTDPEKWRKPDIAADYIGFKVAFEIQLSTTFLNVMAERRKFYLENGGLLVWIFKDVYKNEVRQFQDDILYNNNSNIFVADEESMRLSEECRELVLRCHYLEPVLRENAIAEEWREELVAFSRLKINRYKQQIYFFDFEEAQRKLRQEIKEEEDADLRSRFTMYWSELGLYAFASGASNGEWPKKWAEIKADFERRSIAFPEHDLNRFACLTLSIFHGKCIGFKYSPDNLLQVANYAYDNCKDLLWYFGDLLELTGNYRKINGQDRVSAEKKQTTGKEHRGWDTKWPVVKAVYRDNDPAYPQKRDFDDLYNFLFNYKNNIENVKVDRG